MCLSVRVCVSVWKDIDDDDDDDDDYDDDDDEGDDDDDDDDNDDDNDDHHHSVSFMCMYVSIMAPIVLLILN